MKKKIFLLIPVLFACVVLVGVLFSSCGTKKLDLSKYYSIEVYGLDGKANAQIEEVDLSDEEIIASMMTDLELPSQNYADIVQFNRFFESIKITLSKESKIENGDNITANVEYDQELADTYGFKVSSNNLSLKVEGLEKGENIDIFERVSVKFEHASPMLTATIVNESNNEFVQSIDFRIRIKDGSYIKSDDNNRKLPENRIKNGDTIIIDTGWSEELADSLAADYGLIIEEYEKEVVVKGCPEYITSADQLTDDMKTRVTEKAQELIDLEIENNPYSFRHSEPKVQELSKELYIAKDSNNGDINRICLMYLFTVDYTFLNEEREETTYGIVIFDNAYFDEKGDFMYDEDYLNIEYSLEKAQALATPDYDCEKTKI